MEWNDIIYLVLLFSSIGFGHIFRQVDNKDNKKWLSTTAGFLIVLIVSRQHILHPLLCIVVNAIVIKYCNKRSIHVISFGFTFLYLLFMRMSVYFGIPYPPAHTNLIQMILTLKLVGLAFEVHDSEMAAEERDLNDDSPYAEMESNRVAVPSFTDIFHYSFCYIGVLTGPYFKYRMFCDLFNTPFAANAPCLQSTIDRLKPVLLWAAAFLLSSYIFPLKYAQSDEFYTECSVLYRLWYLYPSFFNFRMRMYIGMCLSECVFIMSGLGAYPDITQPMPGQGPTKEHAALATIAVSSELAKKQTYSFNAIRNIDAWNSDFKPTIRSSMKYWNMTVQHWLAVNVYKRFPIKSYRLPVTFMVSSVWHGVYAGYYLCLCSVPLYLPAEDMFYKAFKDKSLPPVLNYIWIFFRYWWKMLHFSYWSMAFSLLSIDACLRYWSSIYFIPNILTVAMYVIGLTVLKKPKSKKVE